jgi:5'-nucleotidase
VGRLIVGFDAEGNIVEADERSGPVRVAGGSYPDALEPDAAINAAVTQPVAAYVADLASRVVAQSEVPLDGRRANVRTRETNEGNLVADALLWQARERAASFGVPLPQVAFQNGGGIRNDSEIPAGPITELNTFSILPFLNFVAIAPAIPREQFKELLENAVSRVEFTDGRFAQVAGFSFTWLPAGTPQVVDNAGTILTPGSRVRRAVLDDGTVIIDNGVVVAGAPLVLATIDFTFRGGDQYPFRGAAFTPVGVTYQQALANYLRTGLGGVVRASQYPVGGSGRITRLP